jgi:glucose/arabinose dehydrogenase
MFGINLVFLLLFLSSFICNNPKNLQEPKSTENTYKVEIFAENLEVPWSIVFTDSNRILITERPGRLRVIKNGKIEQEPIHVFEEISSKGEEGLMGLTLDPDYKANKIIYISYAYKINDNMRVKVMQYKDDGKDISEGKIIIDNLPAAQYHCGCRLKFGPDKKLYITTGDAGNREYAQDLDKLFGKILRLNSDGSIPLDNPFPNSPIWCYGNRNSQGIDWYPGTDIMWETEHGPSGFDGPGGGDEVNIIVKGKNYGWPIVHHRDHKDGMEDPILEFTPAVAPASGMFYRSGVISGFKNNFFFGCLIGNGIMRVVVDEKNPTKPLSFEKICTTYGRIRDVAEGPDGAIYFGTSNRDGRGHVADGDDKIYRMVPDNK